MFNERGMTSRQSFGSRIYAVLQEGSAGAAGAGSAPGGRFGKAFLGSEDRRPGTAGTSCLHVFSLRMSLVPLQAEPQGAADEAGCAGGGLAECSGPAWSARSHSAAPQQPPRELGRSLHGLGHPSVMGYGVVAQNLS